MTPARRNKAEQKIYIEIRILEAILNIATVSGPFYGR